jgi:hypothetical protein
MTCERFREVVVGLADVTSVLDRAERGHLDTCAECRAWFARFAEGVAAWEGDSGADLTAAVADRTSGKACGRARGLMAGAVDEAPGRDDAALLREHVEHCEDCQAFEADLACALAGLPALAEMDPGPGFVPAVLARTSGRTARATWVDHARAAWQVVVRRPRFAWETAYVCTLCWLLVFGHPVAAFDWTTARVSAAAATAVPERLQSARGHVRALKDQLVVDVTRTAGGVVEAGRDRAEAAARTWQGRAMGWANDRAAAFVDDVVASWRAVVAWFTGTEPSSAPVRSSQ